MHKPTLVARILLGLIFFVFGWIGLLNLMPTPPMTGPIADFMNGIVASRYFFPLLKCTEIACGAMLLSGWFVPLALVVLAPIVIHILCVHAFMEPSGLPMAIVIAVLLGYLAFFSPVYSPVIKTLFRKK